jgi:hypothetical protein
MADDLYDEFGNYIGPALEDSEVGDSEIAARWRWAPQLYLALHPS